MATVTFSEITEKLLMKLAFGANLFIEREIKQAHLTSNARN